MIEEASVEDRKITLKSVLLYIVSGRFWLEVIKALFLAFVAFMIVIQIPELLYDTLGDRPVIIESPEDLDPQLLLGTSYAKISGTPTFENAFVYERYGLRFTYFTVEPYGLQILARAFEVRDTEAWEAKTQLEGKLRPFDSQPFSYAIQDIFEDENGVPLPEGTFYLGVGDVPATDWWQIGSMIFALVLFAAMVYFFYFFRRNQQHRFFSDPLDYLHKDQYGRPSHVAQAEDEGQEKPEDELVPRK